MNRYIIIFVAILVLGGGWLWWSRPPADAAAALKEPQPAANHPAPDFTLPRYGTDESVSLSDLRGKPLVLNFWATWCGPCRNEMPILQAASERYADDIRIVGVDYGEDPQVVGPFLEELGVTFPILLDQAVSVGNLYRVMGLPTTFFIGADGVIRQVYAGELNSAILAQGIVDIAR